VLKVRVDGRITPPTSWCRRQDDRVAHTLAIKINVGFLDDGNAVELDFWVMF
jgi:hypothetical protein